MRFRESLVKGIYIERLNRFVVRVKVAGKVHTVHLTNSGRLQELLIKGQPAYLSPAQTIGRKTKYDLALMETESGIMVSVNAQLPNILFKEAFRGRSLAVFSEYTDLRSEVTQGNSRLDFVVSNLTRQCLIEVKSITLVNKGIGYFPDARTSRGVRHIRELIETKASGDQAAIVFIV